MRRPVYVGSAPKGVEASAELAICGTKAICGALRPGAKAGDAYEAWLGWLRAPVSLTIPHCGYLVGISFPPSWTGGSMVISLFPKSTRTIEVGMVVHAHS